MPTRTVRCAVCRAALITDTFQALLIEGWNFSKTPDGRAAYMHRGSLVHECPQQYAISDPIEAAERIVREKYAVEAISLVSSGEQIWRDVYSNYIFIDTDNNV